MAGVPATSAMFTRRCERHRIALAVGVDRDFEGPPATGLAVVTLFLAMIRAAEAGTGPFQARIAVDGPIVSASLLDAAGALVAWPSEAVEKIADVLADEGSASAEGEGVVLRLESTNP